MQVSRASMILRLVILLALTSAGFGFPLIPRVSAAKGPVLLKGADVVELPPLSLTVKPATATRELLQGERVRDTCRFSMSFHAEAGDTTPQLATVVAVDPESCLAEIERGEPTSVPTEGEAGREGPSFGASAADVGAEGQNKNRKATMWTIWEDPAKATVAVTRTSVRSFVKNRFIDRAECRLHLDPLKQTGWQEDRNYRDFDCNWRDKNASAIADAHFFNDDFLGPVLFYIEQGALNVDVERHRVAIVQTGDQKGVRGEQKIRRGNIPAGFGVYSADGNPGPLRNNGDSDLEMLAVLFVPQPIHADGGVTISATAMAPIASPSP